MADMEIKKNETIDSGSSARLFTQDEVNKIVRDRLARERQKSQVEELLEEKPDTTEETALLEIDENQNNKNDESEVIETEGFYPEEGMLDDPADIAKFKEIFGAEHKADARDINAFKDWKAYAQTFGTEIEPVDESELARWRTYAMEEAIHDTGAKLLKKDGVTHIVQRGTDTAALNTPDSIMRTLFGLPPKKGR